MSSADAVCASLPLKAELPLGANVNKSATSRAMNIMAAGIPALIAIPVYWLCEG